MKCLVPVLNTEPRHHPLCYQRHRAVRDPLAAERGTNAPLHMPQREFSGGTTLQNAQRALSLPLSTERFLAFRWRRPRRDAQTANTVSMIRPLV